VTADGVAHTWGSNERGQLGLNMGLAPSETSWPTPVQLELGHGYDNELDLWDHEHGNG